MYRENDERKTIGGDAYLWEDCSSENKSPKLLIGLVCPSMTRNTEDKCHAMPYAVDSPKLGDHLLFDFNNLTTFPSIMAFVMACSSSASLLLSVTLLSISFTVGE